MLALATPPRGARSMRSTSGSTGIVALAAAILLAGVAAEARAAGSVVRVEGDAAAGFRLVREDSPS